MSTTTFETTIKNYLDNRAREDSLFAETYKKANKSIKECCRYIISRARKLGGTAVAVDDATVYGWAVHYYDEDNIKVEASSGRVEVAAPAAVVKPGSAKPAAPKRQKATNHRADDSLQLSLFDEL
ncbi:Cas9 inhibitor AcrIIA9 family protein [Phocaeicola faecium]|uniref:PcfK-like family protein n=1 Tax=Phocaeicola faecium TaxID=2762213 RepID=A0ABR8V9W6_9BACT|nr:Cas9 inhibitor AcrIIA9 family protein [Phocaeicola faecium]MBD8001553.1 PcfK-like family protein [Phocaeicola faecium]